MIEDSVSMFIKKSHSKVKALETTYVKFSKEVQSLIQSHVQELQDLLLERRIPSVHMRLNEIISSLVHRASFLLGKKKTRSEKVLSVQMNTPKKSKKPINESLKAYKTKVKDLNEVLRNTSSKEMHSPKTTDIKKKYNSPSLTRSYGKLKQAEETAKELRSLISHRKDNKTVEHINGISIESAKEDSQIIEMAVNVEKYKLNLSHKKKQLSEATQQYGHHVKQLKEENSELLSQLKILGTKKQQIEEELNNELIAITAQKDNIEQDNKELNRRILEIESTIQEHNEQHLMEKGKYTESNLELIPEYLTLKQTKSNLEIENEYLKRKLEQLKGKCEILKNNSLSKIKSSDPCEDNLMKQINLELKKEICALNEHISILNRENMPLYDKISTLNEEIRLLKQEETFSPESVNYLKIQNENCRKEIHSLKEEINDLNLKANLMKAALEQKEEEIDNLQNQLEHSTTNTPIKEKRLEISDSQPILIQSCPISENTDTFGTIAHKNLLNSQTLSISKSLNTIEIEPTKNESYSNTGQKWKYKEKLLTETIENKSKHIESLQDENSSLKLELNVLTTNHSENEAKTKILSLTIENARLQKALYEMEAVEMVQIKVQCLNNLEMLQGKCEQYRDKISELRGQMTRLTETSKNKEHELIDKIKQYSVEIKALKDALELTENPPLLADSVILKRFEHAGVEWIYISQGNTGFWTKKHKVNSEIIEKIELSFEKDYGIFKRLCNEKDWIAESLHLIKDMIQQGKPTSEISLFINQVQTRATEQSFEESIDMEFNDIRNLMRDYTKLQKTNRELINKIKYRDEVINFQAASLQEVREENNELKEISDKLKFVKILIDKLVLSLHLIKEKEAIKLILGIQSILLE